MPHIEIWKSVVGYEGLYKVSNFGKVMSLARYIFCRNGKKKYVPGKLLRTDNTRGYLRVALTRNGKTERFSVHRLVLWAFVGPPEPDQECRHFPDRNPSNNWIGNLQWGTRIENAADVEIHGTRKPQRGEMHKLAKLTDAKVKEILKELAKPRGERMSQKAIAKLHGVCQMVISNIGQNKRWCHVPRKESDDEVAAS